MEVFGHFVFPCFSGFFGIYSFIYRLFRAFLFTILFRHFVLPPILPTAPQKKKEKNEPKNSYYIFLLLFSLDYFRSDISIKCQINKTQ